MINNIYNERCQDTMDKMINNSVTVDGIITSPFYNTNNKQGNHRTLNNTKVTSGYTYLRYDKHIDNLTDDEYIQYTLNLFEQFDKILNKDGVIAYNLSYSSNNTHLMNLVIADIIRHTNFTLADTIVWKKSTAMPNSCSPNKLTRIVEFIYIFVRKDELSTFKTNMKVLSVRDSGQKMYESHYNFIEARNNDGSNNYNKATYSTELVSKIINIYFKSGDIIYDPFMGTGTTAIASIMSDINYIGSEISENQVRYSQDRILEYNGSGKTYHGKK